jgi:putative oxidoreductase
VTPLLRTIGRPLLATPFVLGGLQSLRQPGPLPEMARALGVPQPEAATRLTAGTMVAAGLALGSGLSPVAAPVVLAGCLAGATAGVHRFWEHDGHDRFEHRNSFLTNIGLIGGLAFSAAEALGRR